MICRLPTVWPFFATSSSIGSDMCRCGSCSWYFYALAPGQVLFHSSWHSSPRLNSISRHNFSVAEVYNFQQHRIKFKLFRHTCAEVGWCFLAKKCVIFCCLSMVDWQEVRSVLFWQEDAWRSSVAVLGFTLFWPQNLVCFVCCLYSFRQIYLCFTLCWPCLWWISSHLLCHLHRQNLGCWPFCPRSFKAIVLQMYWQCCWLSASPLPSWPLHSFSVTHFWMFAPSFDAILQHRPWNHPAT